MWNHAWIVVAVVLLALALALVRSSLQAEVWDSRAVVRVLNASSTSVLPDQNRVDPVREVEIQRLYANSAAIEEGVTSRLGPTAGRIESVEITGVPTADAIQFRVSSQSRAVAQQVAQTYADVYVESRRRDLADLTKVQTSKLDHDAAAIKEQTSAIDGRLATIAPAVVTDFRGAPVVPPDSEESKKLRADREALVTRLADIEKQAKQLEVDSSARQGAIAVVAQAERPTEPVQPTPFRDAIVALAFGLFVGLVAALARDRFDDRIRVAADVQVAPPAEMGVVSIPYNRNHAKHANEVVEPREEDRSQEREAYRGLRTTLLFGCHDRESVRRILVCSPKEGDGKTTTAATLALSMASAGRRVALVDCDLRRPGVHAVFGLPNNVGLASVASGRVFLQDAVRTIKLRDSETLGVLTTGDVSDNPAELLMSGNVRAVIDKLAEGYDCVVIDTSPLGVVADALPLASLVDGVLLVARAGRTRTRDVADAVTKLERVSARLLAVVVSQVRSKDGQHASYNGYQTTGSAASAASGSRANNGRGDDSVPGVPAHPGKGSATAG